MDPEQKRLMSKDMLAVLNTDDIVIGRASKRECHERTEAYPNGRLHRAFSVFLFNSKNELLLQKRADSKITFPSLWTNTCCSHPLHTLDELHEDDNIGVKRAAVRKLQHELGITMLKPEQFHFLTRIEYQAFQDDVWLEHEIDYILFGKADVECVLNDNEVSATRYVSQDELRSMISSSQSLDDARNDETRLTPWFELIAHKQLFEWWQDLDAIIARGGLVDAQETRSIHRYGVYKPQ